MNLYLFRAVLTNGDDNTTYACASNKGEWALRCQQHSICARTQKDIKDVM